MAGIDLGVELTITISGLLGTSTTFSVGLSTDLFLLSTVFVLLPTVLVRIVDGPLSLPQTNFVLLPYAVEQTKVTLFSILRSPFLEQSVTPALISAVAGLIGAINRKITEIQVTLIRVFMSLLYRRVMTI
jgi:hypothetical protein